MRIDEGGETYLRINRLWQKLALSFVLAVVVVTLVAFTLVNIAFERRFQSYIQERQAVINQRIVQTLALIYVRSGGWPRETAMLMPHWAMMSGVKIKIVAPGGEVIAQTSENMMEMIGSQESNYNAVSKIPVIVDGVKVGTAYITPVGDQNGVPGEDIRFRQSVSRLIILGGLVAAAVALVISYLLAIRLTAPLEVMTAAARRMEAGDLTQRVNVKSDDEIGGLAEAFNHLAAALKRQEDLRQNLTADIAHELRTPLATIQSHIEAFLDNVMKPDEKNIRSIHEEIVRLTRLVEDLGEIAKLESGKANIVKSKADLNILTDKVVANLKPLFDEKQVALTLDRDAKPLNAKVDPDKIYQVLYNLLANSLKFTASGGETRVSLVKDDRKVSITIKDTGIGIQAKHLPFIFERFYRVDKSRSRTTGGAGIGLTVAKQLVEAHNGQISVTSEPGRGTEFKVTLPLVA